MIRNEPKFSVGQLVTCDLYDGLWNVEQIRQINYGTMICYRYTIGRHEVYHDDIIELWLTAAKIKHPYMQVVGGQKIRKMIMQNNGGNAA